METDKIAEIIENFAPLEDMEEWDNSGWQIKSGNKEIQKVLVALDINDNTVEQAIQNGCGLILSHHPMFFNPIKLITPSYITKAIKHDISIYSAHTNLDKAKGGINDTFASLCGFNEIEQLYEFVKYKKLNEAQDMKSLIERIKGAFGINKLKVINLNKAQFSTVAFCSGAGQEYIELLEEYKTDVYLTADVKYHNAQTAKRMTIIDIGHFNSEYKPAQRVFKKLLLNYPIEVIESKEKDVFEYV